jgi:hypothetical protein
MCNGGREYAGRAGTFTALLACSPVLSIGKGGEVARSRLADAIILRQCLLADC